jgi:hypothetical protein
VTVIVFSSYFDSLVLSTLTEHLSSGGFSGPLYNLQLVLLSVPIPLTPGTIFNNLTEANYSGYARVSGLTWGSPILQGDGTFSVISALETFIAASASNFVSNVIYGYALIDTSGSPNLILSEMFAVPIPIAAPSDGFGLAIVVNQGANNGASAAQVVAAT